MCGLCDVPMNRNVRANRGEERIVSAKNSAHVKCEHVSCSHGLSNADPKNDGCTSFCVTDL